MPFVMVPLFALFPGTESSMAIKSQNFQRAYLKDSFLCNCCEYFFFFNLFYFGIIQKGKHDERFMPEELAGNPIWKIKVH